MMFVSSVGGVEGLALQLRQLALGLECFSSKLDVA
jgi:hypothetical protein